MVRGEVRTGHFRDHLPPSVISLNLRSPDRPRLSPPTREAASLEKCLVLSPERKIGRLFPRLRYRRKLFPTKMKFPSLFLEMIGRPESPPGLPPLQSKSLTPPFSKADSDPAPPLKDREECPPLLFFSEEATSEGRNISLFFLSA